MDASARSRYPHHSPLMQSTPHVSVLRALFVMTVTIDVIEIWELLQFHPAGRVDMDSCPL